MRSQILTATSALALGLIWLASGLSHLSAELAPAEPAITGSRELTWADLPGAVRKEASETTEAGVPKIVDLAQQAFDRGDYALAIALWRKTGEWLRGDHAIQASIGIGECLFLLGDIEGAGEQYTMVSGRWKTGSVRHGIYLRLDQYFQAKEGSEPGDEVRRLPGMPRQKLERLAALAAWLHQGNRPRLTHRTRTRSRRPSEGLRALCTASELVTVTELECRQNRALCRAAFRLLGEKEVAWALTEADVARLTEFLTMPREGMEWKAAKAHSVLLALGDPGIQVLVRLLRPSVSAFSRVHAAGALTSQGLTIDVRTKRMAQTELLKALSNDDDTSRLAHNYLGREAVSDQGAWSVMEPWMVKWLINALTQAEIPAALRLHGTSRLAGYRGPEFPAEREEVLIRALGCPKPSVRISAVNGLASLGLKQSSLGVYQSVLNDQNPHVRRMMYAGLSSLGSDWTAQLLVAGLDDGLSENRIICGRGLSQLKHKPALGKLIHLLCQVPDRDYDVFRELGKAVVNIAGLRGYHYPGRPRHGPENAETGRTLKAQAEKLIQWWKEEGAKMYDEGE